MDKLYRIGETAKILGLSSHTLKHYEDKGLIKPVLNEESGYRYYTYRDVGIIITIRNFREMGFTVEEAGDLLGSDPMATQQRFDQQLAHNETAIQDLLHKNEVLKIRSASLLRCLQNKGKWAVSQSGEPLVFIPHFNNDILLPGMERVTKEQAWESVREDCELAFRFDPNTRELGSANSAEDLLTWGIVPYIAPLEQSTLSESARRIPAGPRLDVFFESDRDTVGENAFEATARALAESGARPVGEALCLLNSYSVANGHIEVLATITIPLEK